MSEKSQKDESNLPNSSKSVNGEEAKESSSPNTPTKTVVVNETPKKTKSAVKVLENKVITKNDLEALNYTTFDTPAKMMALSNVLVKSQLVPLTKPEDVVTALMTGKELGLPFITSISQIYPINGRPTLGVHIQKALCLKQGIIFEKVEDAESVYQFVECDAEGKIKVEDGKPVIIHTGTIKEQPKNTKKREITKRTKIKATRMVKRPDGSFVEMVAFGEFSLIDATQAELISKDVWKKFWKRMLEARAYTNVIKEIASDITLGMSTPMELSDEFYVDDKGTETIIDVT